MKQPKDFRKSLYVTQGIGTGMYLLAGAGVYGIAGDASWLKSPINTTLKSGAAFYAVQIMIILHITFVALISGTFFVRAVNRVLGPYLLPLIGRQLPKLQAVYVSLQTKSASSVSAIGSGDESDTDNEGSVQEAQSSHPVVDSRAQNRVVWFISTLLSYGGAMLVAMIIPYFSEILGLIASLISTQVC